jgi:hypothetical protein
MDTNGTDGVLERIKECDTDAHPLRSLAGAAYAAIKPFIASIDDDHWDAIFGLRVSIHGGCELQVDNERFEKACEDIEHGGIVDELGILVPMVICDPYYPRLGIVVPLRELICNCNRIGGPSNGPRHARGRSRCAHVYDQSGCLSCVYKWWQGKANRVGLQEGRHA